MLSGSGRLEKKSESLVQGRQQALYTCTLKEHSTETSKLLLRLPDGLALQRSCTLRNEQTIG